MQNGESFLGEKHGKIAHWAKIIPAEVHICLTFFEKVIVPPCSIVLFEHTSMFFVHPLIF